MQLRNRIQGLIHLKGSEVIPNPANFRSHPKQQRDVLRAAMEDLGIIAAGIVRQLPDGSYMAIDGHLRGEDNPDETLPWLLVDLNEEEAKKAILTLDPVSAMAEINKEVLNEVLQTVDINDEEIQKLCAKLADDAGLYKEDKENLEDDEIPQTPENPVTRLGDVWVVGPHKHRIMCGSSTDPQSVRHLMAGNIPHMMVTDPPYGVVYNPGWRNEAAEKGLIQYAARREGKVLNDERVDWTEAYKLFEGDVVYVWHAGKHTGEVSKNIQDAGFEIRSQLIWKKPNFAISRGDYHWQHEPLLYACRKGRPSKWCGDRSQSTIWEISNRLEATDKTDHGTQKPLECMARPIRNHGKDDDSVYDPFGGSGTTMVASEEIGRQSFLMELHPPYVDVTLMRMRSRFGSEITLEETGQSFEEVAQERLTSTQTPA